jgi:hypothetical protein
VHEHDGLPAVDYARRTRADRATGARRNGAGRHLDIAVGQPAVQGAADLPDLRAQPLGDQPDG